MSHVATPPKRKMLQDEHRTEDAKRCKSEVDSIVVEEARPTFTLSWPTWRRPDPSDTVLNMTPAGYCITLTPRLRALAWFSSLQADEATVTTESARPYLHEIVHDILPDDCNLIGVVFTLSWLGFDHSSLLELLRTTLVAHCRVFAGIRERWIVSDGWYECIRGKLVRSAMDSRSIAEVAEHQVELCTVELPEDDGDASSVDEYDEAPTHAELAAQRDVSENQDPPPILGYRFQDSVDMPHATPGCADVLREFVRYLAEAFGVSSSQAFSIYQLGARDVPDEQVRLSCVAAAGDEQLFLHYAKRLLNPSVATCATTQLFANFARLASPEVCQKMAPVVIDHAFLRRVSCTTASAVAWCAHHFLCRFPGATYIWQCTQQLQAPQWRCATTWALLLHHPELVRLAVSQHQRDPEVLMHLAVLSALGDVELHSRLCDVAKSCAECTAIRSESGECLLALLPDNIQQSITLSSHEISRGTLIRSVAKRFPSMIQSCVMNSLRFLPPADDEWLLELLRSGRISCPSWLFRRRLCAGELDRAAALLPFVNLDTPGPPPLQWGNLASQEPRSAQTMLFDGRVGCRSDIYMSVHNDVPRGKRRTEMIAWLICNGVQVRPLIYYGDNVSVDASQVDARPPVEALRLLIEQNDEPHQLWSAYLTRDWVEVADLWYMFQSPPENTLSLPVPALAITRFLEGVGERFRRLDASDSWKRITGHRSNADNDEEDGSIAEPNTLPPQLNQAQMERVIHDLCAQGALLQPDVIWTSTWLFPPVDGEASGRVAFLDMIERRVDFLIQRGCNPPHDWEARVTQLLDRLSDDVKTEHRRLVSTYEGGTKSKLFCAHLSAVALQQRTLWSLIAECVRRCASNIE